MHHSTKALWQDKQYEHVGAYYTLGYDAKNLFQGLKMEACDTFAKHLNKHHVIYIDFSRLPDVCRHYEDYIRFVQNGLKDDLEEA